MPAGVEYGQGPHVEGTSSVRGARFASVLYGASTGFIAVATAFGCSPSLVTRIPFVQAAALWVHTWA